MKRIQTVSRHFLRASLVFLHLGLFLLFAGYAVMLFVDARAWHGYGSFFRALFFTYAPAGHAVLLDPAVTAGWAFISLGGALSVFTVVFLLKRRTLPPFRQAADAVLVFAPMLVLGLLMFFRESKPAVQAVSLAGLAAVCVAFFLHVRTLPSKMRGASDFAVSVACACVLFLMANVYAYRHDVIFDVSSARFYSLSPVTKKMLAGLDKKVKVYVVLYRLRTRKGLIYEYTKKLFDQVTNLTDNVTVQFLEPFSRKAERLRKRYGITEYHEALIFECGERTKAVPVSEDGRPLAVLKEKDRRASFLDEKAPEIEAYKGENVFYLAVNEVTSERKQQIIFLEGHGERSITEYTPYSLSELSNELSRLNYVVLTASLRQGEVPVCDTLVIAGPRTKFADWEVELIKRFLRERNGSLIYFAEPILKDYSVSEAGLAGLMSSYGIDMQNDFIILYAEQLKTHLPEISSDTYGYHPITKSFTNERVLMTSVRSLREGTCSDPRMDVVSLLAVTSGLHYTLWGETRLGLKTRSVQLDARDHTSPFDIIMLAGPREKFDTPRIIVFGDVDVASNKLLRKGNNKRFLLNCFNWSLRRKEVDVVEPRKFDYIKIDVSDELMANIAYLVVVCLPGFILLYGVLVLIRRRA